MKIVIDENIPFLKNVFEPFAKVVYRRGNDICRADIDDAQILAIRTRTRCNEALLGNSGVKMVSTATIGTDHLDIPWLESAGIKWSNAPGSNSGSVYQYIASVLSLLILEGVNPSKTKIGIVGVGMVGSKIRKLARTLGFKVILNDPPRERNEQTGIFDSYQTLINNSDIITFHTPLKTSGEDATYHLFNSETLSRVKPGVIVINTSRGEVVSNEALLKGLHSGVVSKAILDVWENEPKISASLLASSWLATPHIAGYSVDGKANASRMTVEAISKEFNFPLAGWQPVGLITPENNHIAISNAGNSPEIVAAEAIMKTYDIRDDDKLLRASPTDFENIRNKYPPRREFDSYFVAGKGLNKAARQMLVDLGFNVKP